MILCQRDPRWKDMKIGSSNITIGEYGCTLTCLAEINNDFGQNCTPDQVAAHKDWFNLNGELIWPKVALKGAKFEWRAYGFDLPRIKESVNNIGLRCAVRVRLSYGYHWLKVTGINWNGRIMADDPWSGKNIDVVKVYGSINGSVHFSKRA